MTSPEVGFASDARHAPCTAFHALAGLSRDPDLSIAHSYSLASSHPVSRPLEQNQLVLVTQRSSALRAALQRVRRRAGSTRLTRRRRHHEARFIHCDEGTRGNRFELINLGIRPADIGRALEIPVAAVVGED